MNPLSIAGGVLGAVGSIYGMFHGMSQQHQANQIHPVWEQYNASPYAKDQLGLAQQLYNGRMAGASAEERNIGTAQSNLTDTAERNATSGGQVLAMAAAGQGQADSAYNNLAIKEDQNKYALLGNLNNAYGVNINEGDKVYQSKLQKYQIDMQRKMQLSGAGAANISNGIQGLGSMGVLMGNKLQNNN